MLTVPGDCHSRTSAPASPTGPKSWAWCSSDAFGTFNTSDGFDLYNNEWNSSGKPGPQRICGNSGRDWQVTSTQRAGNTAGRVLTAAGASGGKDDDCRKDREQSQQ